MEEFSMLIEHEKLEEFSKDFEKYIKKEFNYKVVKVGKGYNNVLEVDKPKVRLFMRYKAQGLPWDVDTFVIARFGFEQRRAGHGTRLLTFLCDMSAKYSFNKIGIETAPQGDSAAFAIALGFERFNELSWLIDVDTLRKNLEERSH